MRILVISQYYYPEQIRITDICETLASKGHQVTVIGIPNYPVGKFFDGYSLIRKRHEIVKGVEIVRIPLVPRGKNFVCLSLNYISYTLSGLIFSHFTSRKADIVFNYQTSPVMQCFVGLWFAKRRKIPCVSYILDLWPESVAVVTGISTPLLLHPIGKLVDSIYNRSTKILTSSNSFIEAISNRGISKEKIEFWPQYAEEFYQPIKKENLENELIQQDGRLNIVFAGNVGIAQGLEILIPVAKKAKNSGLAICFVIIGDGRAKESLQQQIVTENLTEYFLLIEKQPATKIPTYLACTDAALVVLKKSLIFSKTIPAKVQSYLACGIPVIVSADGEVQQVIKEAKAGFVADSEDADGLFKAIIAFSKLDIQEREMLRNNAKDYSEKLFSKEKLICRLEDIFQSLEQENGHV